MNVRGIILETLLLIRQGDDFGDRIIKDVLNKHAYLDRQHRSFLKRVTEGTLERRIELDHIIDRFSKTPTGRMKPVILCILEMSVYQLKYMDAIPASAVCNEAVKLAKQKGFTQLAGFVNGVLRNIARNPDQITYPDPKEDPVGYLKTVYAMPEFLVRHFLKHYPERTEEILRAFFREPDVTVRIMGSKTSEEELTEKLQGEAGLERLPSIADLPLQIPAYALKDYDRLEQIGAFREGLFAIQDQASMQAMAQVKLKKGDVVLDVCAAPGGKSLQACDELCKLGGGRVTACDISEKKTALIRENAERLGMETLQTSVVDATVRQEDYVNSADVVIADLPCSGLGIIGRKADIKYRITKEDLDALCELQRKILQNVSAYVKSGGTLLYSTCTLNPAENEEMAEWIASSLPFRLQDMHQIFPGPTHDGFFFAVFTKLT